MAIEVINKVFFSDHSVGGARTFVTQVYLSSGQGQYQQPQNAPQKSETVCIKLLFSLARHKEGRGGKIRIEPNAVDFYIFFTLRKAFFVLVFLPRLKAVDYILGGLLP